MIKTIETKGDTIDLAIEKALQILGLDRDDVSVEVLEKPKSGFLGIGREPALVRVQYEIWPDNTARSFLDGLLFRMGVSATIKTEVDSAAKVLSVEICGSELGHVIGRHGDTLDAIQYLTSIVTNRDEDDRWRVTIDAENYRAKREATLIALASRTAEKVLKYKKGIALDPMSPHERRIVHASLQGYKGVTTYSTGIDPNRKVIVAPADRAAEGKGEPKPRDAQPSKRPNRHRRRPGKTAPQREAGSDGA